ncbi:helix-turn-helix domain-containing protein [Caldivirga sp. UBA161]|uniref:helix-turn-helix domain-containing protein n=1 Tax=Caldivirga sp. UBA161 TaxID=1915569 RepID=UPI0025B7D2F0|nr:helix-turn-helix domain-containing protein [Caldivirga sp. UBA161]
MMQVNYLNLNHGFTYVEFNYIHKVDWTYKASNYEFSYNVFESHINEYENYALEFAILKINDKATLKNILNIIKNDANVKEIIETTPLNTGYPKRLSIVLKVKLDNSTRLKAHRLGGIEVKDIIINGVENWGFALPSLSEIDKLKQYLAMGGEVKEVRIRRINAGELIHMISYSKLTPFLSKGELKVLKVAYELGFFSEPRRATLSKVADALGLSTTTVNYEVRKGIYKLLTLILRGSYQDY